MVSNPARNGNVAAAGQKNAFQPARKVLRRYLGQEKVSKSARNGNATACRAEKCPSACAEGAPEAFGAGKGIKICLERDTRQKNVD